ncbi:MAG: nitrous oxide reductase accessory protein NosL [Thermodesulfobacteriota bacterium]
MKIKLTLIVFIILAASCSDKPESGPVKIYYGEDICEKCKMIISEKDFAAQYQLSNGSTLKFDDLGCMIHYMDGEETTSISDIYVRDYSSKEWTDGNHAYYVWTESINTPMDYGIIGFQDRNLAKELSEKENGKYLGSLQNTSDWTLQSIKQTQY